VKCPVEDADISYLAHSSDMLAVSYRDCEGFAGVTVTAIRSSLHLVRLIFGYVEVAQNPTSRRSGGCRSIMEQICGSIADLTVTVNINSSRNDSSTQRPNLLEVLRGRHLTSVLRTCNLTADWRIKAEGLCYSSSLTSWLPRIRPDDDVRCHSCVAIRIHRLYAAETQ
jgi:hypothetical protein